jgi:hypothetical protein
LACPFLAPAWRGDLDVVNAGNHGKVGVEIRDSRLVIL